MGCSTCKGTQRTILSDVKIPDNGRKTLIFNILEYLNRIIIFLFISIIIVPFIIPIFLYVLFKSIVLSKQINMMPLLLYVGRQLLKVDEDFDEEDEYDDEYDDEMDFEEYVNLNKDDITVINNVK